MGNYQQLSGKFYLDSYDCWTVFNVVYHSGAEGFMNYPEAKPRITRDWKDRNGIDTDKTTVFKERNVTLNLGIYIPDGNYQTFWDKYEAFIYQLTTPDWHRFEFHEFGMRAFYVVYDKSANAKKHTTLKDRDGKGIMYTFALSVVEVEPSVTKNKSAFIGTNGNKFLIT